jgi:hypothetical protein
MMSVFALGLTVLLLGAASANPLFDQVTEKGISPDGRHFVELPPPSMADGLSADQQRAVIARVAGPGRRVDDLMRDSVVAPLVVEVGEKSLRPDGPIMRTVDLWFIAHGDLDKLGSEESLEKLSENLKPAGQGDLPETRGVLGKEAMRARGIYVEDAEDRRQRFVYATFPLFDRVLVSATQRMVVTGSDRSVLAAGVIDAAFDDDPDFPNRWQRLARDALGRFEIGQPQVYRGAGFYVKATLLQEPPDAIFVEYHQAFCEPVEWFGGAPLLRSKLPLLVQDGVRKFRRELRRLSEPESR